MPKTRSSPEALSGTEADSGSHEVNHSLEAARLIMAATDKGQVAKSYFFQNLVQWLNEHPLQPGYLAFDLDVGENRTLSLCHEGNPRVKTLDLSEDDALDDVVKCLGKPECDISIVDGRGGSFESVVFQWAQYSDVFSLGKELGFKITLVLFLAENDELVKQNIRVMEAVGDLADWIVVKNDKISRTFKLWDEGRGAELANKLGAKVVCIRRLYDNMARFYTQNKVTLVRGAELSSEQMLESRRFIKEWRHVSASFTAVQDLLLPPALAVEAGRTER